MTVSYQSYYKLLQKNLNSLIQLKRKSFVDPPAKLKGVVDSSLYPPLSRVKIAVTKFRIKSSSKQRIPSSTNYMVVEASGKSHRVG